jgi:hypothetical protein
MLSYIYRQIAVPWLTARKKTKDERHERENIKAAKKEKVSGEADN